MTVHTPRLMTKDELDAITRVAIARAQSGLNDVFDEFESRYGSAPEHALIQELRQRSRETLGMLIPFPERKTAADAVLDRQADGG